MKRTCLILIYFALCATFLYAQEDEVLFKLDGHAVMKKEVLETLPQSRRGKDISIDEFNRVLNFYLSIYDLKSKKIDTTQVFKRNLESRMLRALSSVYSSQNHRELINKCMISHNSFPVVNDLFVPFEPVLLREIKKLQEQNATFEEIVKYAMNYEGSSLNSRMISPTESSWMLNNIACKLIEGKQKIVGPVKGSKGYHYLRLLRKQQNFGTYTALVIEVPTTATDAKKQINKAYKELKKGADFEEVAKKTTTLEIVRTFVPSATENSKLESELQKLTANGKMSSPFLANGSWYIIKRLGHENYPSDKALKKQALLAARRPAFFIEELKERYGLQEFPYNFLSGRDKVLFLVDKTPYYTTDLKKYIEEYGYKDTSESYDYFLHHLLAEKYKRELEPDRYQRLLDDFYFMQVYNPILLYQQKGNGKFIQNLRKLTKKYKPFIPNKKYVENNPVFETK